MYKNFAHIKNSELPHTQKDKYIYKESSREL